MRIGGASVMGSYHEKNQDNILAEETAGGWLIAVSDGVGSCAYSEIGSTAACRTVGAVIKRFDGIPADVDLFFREIHAGWISDVSSHGHTVCECYATLLFCFCRGNRLFAARLGDGIIGIKADGQDFLMFDTKKDHYNNETDCLFEVYDPSAWEVLDLECSRVEGVVATTDGLSLAQHERNAYMEFVSDIIAEYRKSTAEEIVADLHKWLPEWEGSDDRSVVFMMGELD